jgi:hypothetical protein
LPHGVPSSKAIPDALVRIALARSSAAASPAALYDSRRCAGALHGRASNSRPKASSRLITAPPSPGHANRRCFAAP